MVSVRLRTKWLWVRIPLLLNKSRLHKILEYWSINMLIFDFLEKGLGLVSPPHLTYDFSRKMFPMLHSIYWPNFIVWLPLFLEILDNICIVIVCFSGCDAINFEINLIFPIRPFFYITKNSRQTFKYLQNEKSF